MNQTIRTILLIVILAGILGSIWFLQSSKSDIASSSASEEDIQMADAQKSSQYEPAKEIVNPSGFINTDPFQLKDLIGKKVILVDFWTYSCINCQRTLPYLTAWYDKYKDQGLEIVGIHSPEFEFEKDYDNVLRATEKWGITYPVVLDNDFSTWRAYGNRYWPRKYLIDIDGYIVYDHIGEGGYEETERVIQNLLKERSDRLQEEHEVSEGVVSPEAPSLPEGGVKSPEIYFGSSRNSFLGNGTPSGTREFTVPESIRLNAVYLGGTWTFDPEYAKNTGPGQIVFRYSAKNVYMVAEAEEETPIRIFRDGTFLKEVLVSSSDLYTLIEGEEYGEHILEIQVPQSGLKAFTFTFG